MAMVLLIYSTQNMKKNSKQPEEIRTSKMEFESDCHGVPVIKPRVLSRQGEPEIVEVEMSYRCSRCKEKCKAILRTKNPEKFVNYLDKEYSNEEV